MSWTTPKTWAPNDALGASDFNTHIRDNETYLFARPLGVACYDNGATYTTTNTSFADLDATNYKITKTLAGTAVLVGFEGSVDSNAVNICADFDIDIDGTKHGVTTLGYADGLKRVRGAGQGGGGVWVHASFVIPISGLTPGSHVFKLQWRVSATGTAYLAAGDNTAGKNFPAIFWVWEIG